MTKVKELRLAHNLKQENLADILEISAVNYSKKENGQVKFSLNEAKKIADFFGASVDEIFFEE